jgi:hypothetical protein
MLTELRLSSADGRHLEGSSVCGQLSNAALVARAIARCIRHMLESFVNTWSASES